MSDTVMDTVDVERMAFIEGDHGDPFSFLGMHTAGGEGHLVVRTFQPRADTVAVIDIAAGTAVAELDRVHPDGLFEGTIAGRQEAFAYRLAVTVDGTTSEIEDPYRFGAVLGSLDEHLLAEGNHLRAFDKMGAHVTSQDGVAGVSFAVWAPSARRASVVGDFNGWDGRCHPMRKRHGCGVWELFIPGLAEGLVYKYELKAANGTLLPLKADPFGFYAEQPPNTASRVYDLDKFEWQDQEWMARREDLQRWDRPISIYEVHLGSWRRVPDDGHRWLSYRELAETLVPYVKDMGFTHVELLPVSEYPFDGSWGYQPIGLYAPTSRHGDPDDFRHLVQAFHDAGIGVLIDWVAGHFPTDAHGLGYFDGTHLYEHADPRQGFHRDWNTLIYNYGRVEVANFLLANAAFWLEKYHIDGLRVDAVASMLYLDYSREGGDWIPNQYGGNENIEAIQFLRRMNELLYGGHSGAITMAEESTSWPMVSRPTSIGGLGFGFKWNMGWMHDTLRYMSRDPIHRRWHQDDMTFGLLYAFHENFILPLSHDEVVHGKGSLIGRMPGDIWQRFANLRAYYGFMWTHPGKKLLFMGGEIAQWREWHHNESLDWHLLDEPFHGGVQQLVRDLNRFYCATPALYEQDSEAAGFEWIDCHDSENSVVSYVRYARDRSDMAVVVVNLTPQVHQDYRIGVPAAGTWREVLNTDAPVYGGSGVANAGPVAARDEPWHNRPFSLGLTLPPLATIVLAPERAGRDAP